MTDNRLEHVRPVQAHPESAVRHERLPLVGTRVRIPAESRGEDAIGPGTLVNLTVRRSDAPRDADHRTEFTVEYLVVDDQGRLTIPARYRKLFGLGDGDELDVTVTPVEFVYVGET